MLVDDKITTIIAAESTTFDRYADIFNNELKLKGKALTQNFIVFDILYYLLRLDLYPNINLELYKKLKHLQEVLSEYKFRSIPNETITTVNPLITVSTGLSFGNVLIGETSTLTATFSAVGLTSILKTTLPAGYTVSLDTNTVFKNSIGILPDSDGNVATTTIYVKFTPLLAQTYSGNITFTSTGATNKTISVTGTGIEGT